MMTPIDTDEHGIIHGFAYHDGLLCGVLADRDGKSVFLSLQSSTGLRRVLTLKGVEYFDVSEFREANIVTTMWLYDIAVARQRPHVVKVLVERLFVAPDTLEAGLQVFVLECAIGADVIALCRGAEISHPGCAIDILPAGGRTGTE